MRIAREAWPFVAPPAVAAVALAAAGAVSWAVGLFVVATLLAAFFRIPARHPTEEEGAVLAAANGVVTVVETCEAPEVGPGTYRRIVTFLSVFNVHVQRAPCAGTVVSVDRQPGRKVAAYRPDAGDLNASCRTILETRYGDRVGVVQIVGLIARRIVAYGTPERTLERGELMGLIRFGSRVDVLLPASYRVTVEVGTRLHEGETVIARRVEA